MYDFTYTNYIYIYIYTCITSAEHIYTVCDDMFSTCFNEECDKCMCKFPMLANIRTRKERVCMYVYRYVCMCACVCIII